VNTPKVPADVIVSLAEAHPAWSNVRLGKSLGISEASVRRGLDKAGFKRHLIPVDLGFEERFNIVLDKPLVHHGDVMITADWHIPLYDPGYVNEMILTARRYGLRDLILAGDFFNFDALSAYDPKQHTAGLENELYEATAVMRVLLESFDTIYYLWGNHDVRLHRALGFAIEFREAMRMVFGILGDEALERVKFTNLDHMWVDVGDAYQWYICHPKSYTSVPLSGAIKLSSKMNAHVITAHSHHCAVGHGVDGQKVVAEIGGLFDKNKTAYLQRTTNFPTWQQGYAFLLDGKLNVSSPGWRLSVGSGM
jgi:hypothetical protein